MRRDVAGRAAEVWLALTPPRERAPPRVTMTPRLINSARLIAVMVTGATKRGMLERVAGARGRGGPTREDVLEVPILAVRPLGGELRWYLDREVCGG